MIKRLLPAPSVLIKLTSLLLVLFFAYRFHIRSTDGFQVEHITYYLPRNSDWDTDEPKGISSIFNQRFYYLGKGAQSYAFGSEDGKYVIKFFKFKHHKPPFWLDWVPIQSYREHKLAKHKRKLDSAYNGYKLAYKKHREGTGLIYLHLNRSEHLQRSIMVEDKAGKEHRIDLDSHVFVVQKRAVMTQDVVGEALGKGDLAAAADYVKQLFSFYRAEYERGIYDRDRCIMKNTGFAEGEPIRVDVGKLVEDSSTRDPDFRERDLFLVGKKFKQWVNGHYPEYENTIATIVDEQIAFTSKN